MPIRSMPFEQVTAEHVEDLQRREVREDRTLDYKRDLNLGEREGRAEVAKDIIAFANASGGTLIYGVEEGTGERQGIIVAADGLVLNADETHRSVDNLLRDDIDERIIGVLHRAIQRADGRYYYVIRVPPSALAPHMVTVGPHRSRFYLRGSTTNDPMDARQIKEVAIRAANAEEKATQFIQQRRNVLLERAPTRRLWGERAPFFDQAFMHVVPLFPPPGGWNFSAEGVSERLRQIKAFGGEEPFNSLTYQLEGAFSVFPGQRYVAFLRNGCVEFQEYDVLTRPEAAPSPNFPVWSLEQDVLEALEECEGLTADGLLPLPAAVSLTLTGVTGSQLQPFPRSHYQEQSIQEDTVPITPIMISAWGDVSDHQVHGMFDEVHQAWGYAGCGHGEGEERMWFRRDQRAARPPHRFR